MLNKFKTLCTKLNLNYKSELSLCIGLLILTIIMMIILALLVSISAGLIILLIYTLFIYFHLSTLNRKYVLLMYKKQFAFETLFLSLINYFKLSLSLTKALEKSLAICDEVIKDDINQLLFDIQDDMSIEPFLKLADNFIDESYKSKAIYLYSALNCSQTCDLVPIFSNFCDRYNNESIEKYNNEKIKSIEQYKFIPIILSSISVLLIFGYIFSTIGEFTNG